MEMGAFPSTEVYTHWMYHKGLCSGRLFFLVKSKDFCDNITSNVICYADDTRLHSVSDSLLECGINMSLRTLRYGFKRIILSSMLKKFKT